MPFGEALGFHIRKHGDDYKKLQRVIAKKGNWISLTWLNHWIKGGCLPRWGKSIRLLQEIERRYGLPKGYFERKIYPDPEPRERKLYTSAGSLVAWHTPADFESRPKAEQQEITNWIRTNVLGASTSYGKYLQRMTKCPYSIAFLDFQFSNPSRTPSKSRLQIGNSGRTKSGRASFATAASPQLAAEMKAYIHFKTASVAPAAALRFNRWNEETAESNVQKYSMLFGCLSAPRESSLAGLGVPSKDLTFAFLIFPQIMDWILQWRSSRRGFLTRGEYDFVREIKTLTRKDTGWLRQNPKFAARLFPIKGLITPADVRRVCQNWNKACDVANRHAHYRSAEARNTGRQHRDPCEPIMPVITAKSPLAEYRKIPLEIAKQLNCDTRTPLSAAETARVCLMIRLAIHTGFRQRNLRELLFSTNARDARPDHILREQRRGELRWNSENRNWEVYAPAIAFKNSYSSFFFNKPFLAVLPDVDELYSLINAYIGFHRQTLLNSFPDPKTLFVRTVKSKDTSATLNHTAFYNIWKNAIQRYGIFNPYTKRGAIKGLLPHGPHCVRDILATHVLKQTDSFELAAYAIHATPNTVRRYYARLLPVEKTAHAAKVLNMVWEEPTSSGQ